MFVKSIELMTLHGDEHQSAFAEPITWERIEKAIREIDGDTIDGVMLNGQDLSYMGIVGDNNGHYVVAGIDYNSRPFILTVGEFNHQWIALSIGGQENEYADNEIISLETVLVVGRTFVELGECDSRFKWKERAAKMSGS